MSETLEEIDFLILRMITPLFDSRYAAALAVFQSVALPYIIVTPDILARYQKYAIRESAQRSSRICLDDCLKS